MGRGADHPPRGGAEAALGLRWGKVSLVLPRGWRRAQARGGGL